MIVAVGVILSIEPKAAKAAAVPQMKATGKFFGGRKK